MDQTRAAGKVAGWLHSMQSADETLTVVQASLSRVPPRVFVARRITRRGGCIERLARRAAFLSRGQ